MAKIPYTLVRFIRECSGAPRAEGRSDEELLAAYTDGHDQRAFTALVVRHSALVWHACRSILGDTPDADDAFQTVFLALARKAPRLRRAPLGPWLHKVARQAALDIRKLRQRRGQRHTRRAIEDLRLRSAAAATTCDDEKALVAEELAALPEKLHAALMLYYIEGKTQAQVGKILGISDRAVAGRLDRGLLTLRKRLARRGLLVTVAVLAGLFLKIKPAAATSASLVAQPMGAATAFANGTLEHGAAAKVAAGLTGPGSGLTGLLGAVKLLNGKAMVLLVASAVAGGTWFYTAHDKPAPRKRAWAPVQIGLIPDREISNDGNSSDGRSPTGGRLMQQPSVQRANIPANENKMRLSKPGGS
jgi:RNA polymerase sigma factor (sigma-70 family)